MWRRLRFPLAVALTSFALVATLFVAGGALAQSALGGGPKGGPPWAGAHGAGGPLSAGWPEGMAIPAELQSLGDIPADQRFNHFINAQINLKDRDGQPVTILAVGGSVTTVDKTSLTIAANDGTTKTYSLDARTVIRGRALRPGSQTGPLTISPGDKVIVVTINGSSTARLVVVGGPDGFRPAR